jgi:hypothetical protein
MENMKEIKSNSEKIWKIQKKIVKRYEKHGKYGRKVSDCCLKPSEKFSHYVMAIASYIYMR